jgi:hypothetical protein
LAHDNGKKPHELVAWSIKLSAVAVALKDGRSVDVLVILPTEHVPGYRRTQQYQPSFVEAFIATQIGDK